MIVYLRSVACFSTILIIFLTPLFSSINAAAQSGFIRRPEETRPELPAFEPPERKPGRVLPPIPLPDKPETERLYKGIRITIKKIVISGGTVFPQEELNSIANEFVKPSEINELTLSDLERLRDLITLKYIRKGYVTSGAVIESIHDGVVRIQIHEGVLDEINVKTDGRLKERYIKKRLNPAKEGVVNEDKIAEILQILKQNPRIHRIKAELKPGVERGFSVLDVNVFEAKPYRMTFQFDNLEPPSVGSYRGLLNFSHLNISGYGDSLNAVVRYTKGLRGLYAMYEVPLNALGTTVDIHADLSTADVIEEPFDQLDIEGESETFGFTITQRLYRRLTTKFDHWFDVFLIGDKRRSQSFLFGQGFPFTEGASEDGESKVTVMRIGQNWTYRTGQQAFALRNTISIGLDLFDATINENTDTADGQFLVYLGQAQYAWRFPFQGKIGQLIARGDVQLADSPLLSLEKIGVGGFGTVRGYRQNEFVRDNALIGSVELRLPVYDYKSSRFELVPFFDIGRVWNENATSEETETISGAGLGLNLTIGDRASAFLYWSHAFDDILQPSEYNLQDDGIYFQLAVSF
jgi:hemolysin activation/secretion protein